MSALVESPATSRRIGWVLTWIQLALAAGYLYGAVAYLTTDADYFSEQAPPSWSWPAVIVIGVGYLPAVLCLVVALLAAVTSPELRADRRQWLWLRVASAAGVVMLLVMATPPGWELFDWYVS